MPCGVMPARGIAATELFLLRSMSYLSGEPVLRAAPVDRLLHAVVLSPYHHPDVPGVQTVRTGPVSCGVPRPGQYMRGLNPHMYST